MFTDRTWTRRRPTSAPARPRAAWRALVVVRLRRVDGASPSAAPAASAASSASQPPRPRSAARAPPATPDPTRRSRYSIWGDPRRSRTSRRSSTRSTRPTRRSPSRSTCRTGSRTGTSSRRRIAGGDAPDVFAMDGPLFPDYQIARRPARPQAVHRPRRLRPRPSWPIRRSPTSRRPTASSGCRATSTSSRSTTTRRCSTRPASPYPDDTWDWSEARRGRQEADDQGRRRQGEPVGLLHRDDRHGELLVRAGLAERRRHHLGRPQDEPRRRATRRPAGSSSCRT